MASSDDSSPDIGIQFGPYLLLPAKQLLLQSDRPVQIGSRAFAILSVLVDRAGDLVTKRELIKQVWPDTVVEEGNLKVHIAALRRVLEDGRNGNRYVVNVPGRGYRFVGAITHRNPPAAKVWSHRSTPLEDLPVPLTNIIGRTETITATVDLLSKRRCVTLVGSGGIGKTTVALAIAHAASSYKDGRLFVDLAPLSDPSLLASSLASRLGIPAVGDPVPQIVRFLANKEVLLLFDSCEHILKGVATLTESLLRGAPHLHVLATSREPLRAAGEVVSRLRPLETPLAVESLTVSDALHYSAIELFVERAASGSDSFQLTDEDTKCVAEICRRLDGNALAIELAAGRVDAFGVRGVAARLENRFDLLKGGRRTALPRHQALSATLDWSYDLLSEAERAVLRRLSIFAGNFSLEAASAVAAAERSSSETVIDCISELVAKSLVSADVKSVDPRYRLLDTTIAYSRQKLRECGEFDQFAKRHAQYYLALFKWLTDQAIQLNPSAWVLAYGDQLDNVRTALDWACAEARDDSLGISLTIAVVPLWLNLSLMDECLQRVRRALSLLQSTAPDSLTQEMHLYNALGVALYSIGPGPETRSAWEQVLSVAEKLSNSDFRLRALWGLWTVCVTGSDQRSALALANEFLRVACEVSDPGAQLVGERLQGISYHFLGELAPARMHLERMLEKAGLGSSRSDVSPPVTPSFPA